MANWQREQKVAGWTRVRGSKGGQINWMGDKKEPLPPNINLNKLDLNQARFIRTFIT